MLPNRLVKYHAWQGKSNDCGPFTTSIVINAMRDEKIFDPKHLAQVMTIPALRWWRRLLPFIVIRRLPNYATMPWGIVDVLNENGIGARWRFGATKDDLLHALDESRIAMPIVGEIKIPRTLRAHVKPLVAYDPSSGFGFVDPAHPKAEVTWQEEEQFLRLWNNWGNILIETLDALSTPSANKIR